MKNSDNNEEIWGVKSENNFGLDESFPEIRFVTYDENEKTAIIVLNKEVYEVFWDIEKNEPETKISDKTGKIFLIISNKNLEKGNSLLCEINGEIKVIDEFYEEGDFLVSKELDLYNVSFQKHKEITEKVGDSIIDVLKSEK